MKILFATLLAAGVMTAAMAAPPSIILRKQRPPELDVSAYRQIAVGDIVGSTGGKTEQSLDLTDALTSKLFNANTLEVVDRNALESIIGSQRRGDLEIIDDATKQLLSRKLKNALLITGRLQSPKLTQNQVYRTNSDSKCPKKYLWEVKGDVTVQLRILDVKTGRMIFTNSITRPVSRESTEDCSPYAISKLDLDQISREAIRELSEDISKLVVPYDVTTTLTFSDPGFFGGSFSDLTSVASLLQSGKADAGLTLLKNYTESKKVKDKRKDDAWYNYGIGLLYAGKYEEAKKAFQMCVNLSSDYQYNVAILTKLMDEEEQVARKMEAQATARQKMLEQPEEPVVEEKPKTPSKPGKPTIAVPVKKKKV